MSIRSGPRRAEQLDLRFRQISLLQDPEADGVVDVVVDVGDSIDDANDLAFERLRLPLARMREDSLADLVGEVQALRDAVRLLVVSEGRRAVLAQQLVQDVLAGVAERRVPGVMAEPDRLDQVLVQPQRSCDDARDGRGLERVGHARSVVVSRRIDEDLGLALQAPEGLRVDKPVAVALERRAHRAFLLGPRPPARLVRADGQRREVCSSCSRMRAS